MIVVWTRHNFTKIRPALFYADCVDRVPVFFVLIKKELSKWICPVATPQKTVCMSFPLSLSARRSRHEASSLICDTEIGGIFQGGAADHFITKGLNRMFSMLSREKGGFINTANCVNFTSSPPPEPFCCHETARCDGCPYPATGFICWCGDGTCMRTEMEKIRLRDAEEKGGK